MNKDYIKIIENNGTFYILNNEIESHFLQYCPLIKETCKKNCVCLEMKLEELEEKDRIEGVNVKKVKKFYCANKSLFLDHDNHHENTSGTFIYTSELSELKQQAEIFSNL